MTPKAVVLGITGSIAAFKACDIVSGLKKRGVDVYCILTKSGAEFITALSLESLSNHPVVTDMFNRESPWEIEHIALAKRADVFLVAPASADFIAKAANGISDDMLTTTILATRAPILIAPAMNTNMYLHSATQANMEILSSRGCRFVEPATGLLACGDVGKGKLANVDEIIEATMALLYPKQDLGGKRILVSAGPTHENLDPVRYLTNRSSGKMGYAVAEAAAERGATVTLVSGPTALHIPNGIEYVDVVTSAEMFEAVDSRFDDCDALIMAAAPADFTPEEESANKIKKNGRESLTLTLKPTRDILAAVGQRKKAQRVLGFAAETEQLKENAKAKLEKKNLDMIAANDVSKAGIGFQANKNAVTLYKRNGGALESGVMEKRALADWLLDRLFEAEEN
ncbi:MAG TPA: bifunctional phosphopantothenoylcysteine decarboxylase/phosphopantothenate--cysteine ligase CoaBC [Clostridia bacterium]|nr:bifunctional phosphopantothenoylcysteine decarboxylase/phosphopantothenate--cysteine ligase CoaBC [Clostridia bacterium]